jgi:hypothetical protein
LAVFFKSTVRIPQIPAVAEADSALVKVIDRRSRARAPSSANHQTRDEEIFDQQTHPSFERRTTLSNHWSQESLRIS